MPPFSSLEDTRKFWSNGPGSSVSPASSAATTVFEKDSIDHIELKETSQCQHVGCKASIKKVSFDLSKPVTTTQEEDRQHLTFDDIHLTWMSADDYYRTRTEATETYRLLDQGFSIDLDDSRLCVLGIETSLRHRNRREIQRMARCAVFAEQNNQRVEGYRCEDLIAMSYMEHTDKSRNLAYLAGVMMSILQAKD